MKRILITGANSYIGTSFENWMKQYDGYLIDTVDTMDDNWKNADFSKYDTVFHVAGIVHKKETKDNAYLYYEVNRDLSIEIANYVKQKKVRQFILLSSMSIYGGKFDVIEPNTVPEPKSNYGKSKLSADKVIDNLSDNFFNVAILRPPMVYGRGCKGNYSRLAKLAVKMPVFPKIDNKRSMIFIDNLCEFVKLVIDNNESGFFYPQNKEYINTSELVKTIAQAHGKHMIIVPGAGFLLKCLAKKFTVFNKLFGDLVYDKKMSDYHNFDYCKVDFKESIKLTEK